MAKSRTDDNLYKASLTADDNVDVESVEGDGPWNPLYLIGLTFFFGLIAGGSLLALNFRKLGMKSSVWSTMFLVVVFPPLARLWFEWNQAGVVAPKDLFNIEAKLRGLEVSISLVIAVKQFPEYSKLAKKKSSSAPLLVPAVIALVISIAVEFAAAFGAKAFLK